MSNRTIYVCRNCGGSLFEQVKGCHARHRMVSPMLLEAGDQMHRLLGELVNEGVLDSYRALGAGFAEWRMGVEEICSCGVNDLFGHWDHQQTHAEWCPGRALDNGALVSEVPDFGLQAAYKGQLPDDEEPTA